MPWADRLLALPAFLGGSNEAADAVALEAGFRLTRYFLARHVYEPRGLDEPLMRSSFITAVARSLPKQV